MKKINSLVLSTITAAFLVGCGGGGSDSGTPPTSGTPTDVTVERGPVLGASVSDSNGQVATQKSGTNVYSFATTPAYPITASGGIIDVDGNGIDEGDIELTSPLMSYSTVITPITNYLSTGTSEERQAKLTKLKEITGVTNDDDFFKKVPSEVSDNKVLVLTNTLYDLMNDDDTSNDNFITDYDNSAFKTKFTELETLIATTADKKEIAKALEEKVIENLGITPLTANDVVNLPTTSTLLKISDLTRFVSYDEDVSWYYSEGKFIEDKISFKYYNLQSNDGNFSWKLEDEEEYVTITKDATNPYKLSFVDPITKEEGTFTILSTKKQKNYTDLYKTKVQLEITKKGTELDWSSNNFENPSYWENNASVAITDIDGVEKYFTLMNSTFDLEGNQVVIRSDGKAYLEKDKTKAVGTWKKENEQIIVTVGKETEYAKVVFEDGKYYIKTALSDSDVGSVYYVTYYSGNNLDDFITDIKAPSLIITSSSYLVADENQTSLFLDYNGVKKEVFKATVEDGEFVTFSLAGVGAKYFKIDSEGIVTFKSAPDYETKKYYSFDLVATNKEGNKVSEKIEVKINDIDENVQ